MEELLEAMNKYWETHETTVEEDGRKFFPDLVDDETGNLINLMWKWLFINGQWNPETKAYLRDNGYRCWIGDGDSYGILVACITKDGKTFSIG